MQVSLFMESGAVLSKDGRYRYSLTRIWDPEKPRVCFVMLNPSSADAEQNDPTIKRCIRFAESWGYGAIEVVNLYAFRTHLPELLAAEPEPCGPDNDAYILKAVQNAQMIIAAWGVHGHEGPLRRAVGSLINREVYCLGTTKNGAPRHPLYVHSSALVLPFSIEDS